MMTGAPATVQALSSVSNTTTNALPNLSQHSNIKLEHKPTMLSPSMNPSAVNGSPGLTRRQRRATLITQIDIGLTSEEKYNIFLKEKPSNFEIKNKITKANYDRRFPHVIRVIIHPLEISLKVVDRCDVKLVFQHSRISLRTRDQCTLTRRSWNQRWSDNEYIVFDARSSYRLGDDEHIGEYRVEPVQIIFIGNPDENVIGLPGGDEKVLGKLEIDLEPFSYLKTNRVHEFTDQIKCCLDPKGFFKYEITVIAETTPTWVGANYAQPEEIVKALKKSMKTNTLHPKDILNGVGVGSMASDNEGGDGNARKIMGDIKRLVNRRKVGTRDLSGSLDESNANEVLSSIITESMRTELMSDEYSRKSVNKSIKLTAEVGYPPLTYGRSNSHSHKELDDHKSLIEDLKDQVNCLKNINLLMKKRTDELHNATEQMKRITNQLAPQQFNSRMEEYDVLLREMRQLVKYQSDSDLDGMKSSHIIRRGLSFLADHMQLVNHFVSSYRLVNVVLSDRLEQSLRTISKYHDGPLYNESNSALNKARENITMKNQYILELESRIKELMDADGHCVYNKLTKLNFAGKKELETLAADLAKKDDLQKPPTAGTLQKMNHLGNQANQQQRGVTQFIGSRLNGILLFKEALWDLTEDDGDMPKTKEEWVLQKSMMRDLYSKDVHAVTLQHCYLWESYCNTVLPYPHDNLRIKTLLDQVAPPYKSLYHKSSDVQVITKATPPSTDNVRIRHQTTKGQGIGAVLLSSSGSDFDENFGTSKNNEKSKENPLV